ncbi:MAG: adenylate cyclase [Gammaproteobacteria bacterium]|jgi:adenylate cyclase
MRLDLAANCVHHARMAMEIEHKFLLCNDSWRDLADAGLRMVQGYLAGDERQSIRVRIAGERAWLNIKHAQSLIVRREFEYLIPLADADEILTHMCANGRVDKTRFRVPVGEHTFEVDVFHGDNDGLIVAEVELQYEAEAFVRPDWLGDEVSHDTRYFNHNLVAHPYSVWSQRAN